MSRITPETRARRSTRDRRVSRVTGNEARDTSNAGAGRPAGRAAQLKAGQAGEPPQAAPRSDAKYVATAGHAASDDDTKRVERRDDRWSLMPVLWRYSDPDKRMKKCRRVRTNEAGDVGVVDNGGVTHFTGLQTCGSIHACPLCSAHTRGERAKEISSGVAAWIKHGGAVLMASMTMAHHGGHRLADTYDAIAKGWTFVQRDRSWRALVNELGLAGKIRTVEVTYSGRGNGWHPHMHILLLFDDELDDAAYTRTLLLLRKVWKRWMKRRDYREPSDRHGVDLRRCYSAVEAAEYIAKTQDGKSVGNELARADMKTGHGDSRTPFQILTDFRDTGDTADLALWREYEDATHGRKAIQWDDGLRARLAELTDELEEEERSDEEIAEEEIGGSTVAVIPGEVWERITGYDSLPAAVLAVAEQRGLNGVNDLLGRYRLYAMPPPEMTPG